MQHVLRCQVALEKLINIDLADTLGTLFDFLPLKGQKAFCCLKTIFEWRRVAFPYPSMAHLNGFPRQLVDHETLDMRKLLEMKYI